MIFSVCSVCSVGKKTKYKDYPFPYHHEIELEITKDAFAKVAYRERPDGLLAVAPQWRR